MDMQPLTTLQLLFNAEDSFQRVVDLLASNRVDQAESAKLLNRIGEHYVRIHHAETPEVLLRQVERLLKTQCEVWVGDYLKRRELLQLYTITDQNLRRVRAYIEGFRHTDHESDCVTGFRRDCDRRVGPP